MPEELAQEVATRYLGEIVSVSDDHYGFIGVRTITREDGVDLDVPIQGDVFVHQEECEVPLAVGIDVSFMLVPDTKRGEGFYRASGAIQVLEAELLPQKGSPIPGFEVAIPLSFTPVQLAYLARMKAVPDEVVSKVIENDPFAGMSRVAIVPPDEEAKKRLLSAFLQYLFPALASYGVDWQVKDFDDSAFDRLLKETIDLHRQLGLDSQIPLLEEEVGRLKAIRSVLGVMYDENLVRHDTIVPMSMLPDLFMAVPVWYFWWDGDRHGIEAAYRDRDPRPNASTLWFSDQFPNQRWRDMYQMFNRRFRTLKEFKGDIIPPHVVRRMSKVVKLFDYVVIMTPYLEEAGNDWTDLAWLRSIDPYVVGFKKGVPVFFILARFSDTGLFPLHTQLVADTMHFLASNKGRLRGFDGVNNPFWYMGPGDKSCLAGLGDHLIDHVGQTQRAFEAGQLFPWLKGEVDLTSAS